VPSVEAINVKLNPQSVVLLNEPTKLPVDINSFSFLKFIQAYIQDYEKWDRILTPITKPFLVKISQADIQDSLSMFKMVLRFVNSNEYDPRRDKLLADYICQKGLMNVKLRDEILIQIVNQTWLNEDSVSVRKAWWLMAECLSCFLPSSCLHKYLLKYASDYAVDEYKSYCQMKLLQSDGIEAQLTRTYPPSLLEWTAAKNCASLALEITFFDGRF